MSTIEQRLRGLALELQTIQGRIIMESDRVDPHFDKSKYQAASTHVGDALEYVQMALACIVDPPEWNR
jgi:hypothetical protein